MIRAIIKQDIIIKNIPTSTDKQYLLIPLIIMNHHFTA